MKRNSFCLVIWVYKKNKIKKIFMYAFNIFIVVLVCIPLRKTYKTKEKKRNVRMNKRK